MRHICAYCRSEMTIKGLPLWRLTDDAYTETTQSNCSHGLCVDCERAQRKELEEYKKSMVKES